MAREPGETLREIYRKVLKLHCQNVKGGQRPIADELDMTRKTFNRALNGHPVDAEYLDRISDYARKVITDDPEIVEAIYKRDERYLLPEIKMSKIIEAATPWPKERCRHLAHEIWRGIRADL